MNSKLLSSLALALGIFFLGAKPCAATPAASWKVTFTHKAGKSAVDMTSAANKQATAELDSIIAHAHGRRLSGIEVKSYSSPEGKLAWNTKLAGLRSEGVKSLVEGKIAGLDHPQIVENNVPEDWDSAVTYLNAVDKPWKDEALKIIKAGENVKAKLEDLWAGEAWDDLLWNCFYAVRRTVVIFTFDTDTEFSEAQTALENEDISIKFAVGRTSIASSYLDNRENLERLKTLANTAGEGKTIVLDAYASPEGRASWNLVLARRRAEAVKAFLVNNGVPADRIRILAVQEDWAGLKEVVEDNWFGADKSEILNILEDSTIGSDAREQKLRALSHGTVWNKLIASWMTDLRRVNIHLE